MSPPGVDGGALEPGRDDSSCPANGGGLVAGEVEAQRATRVLVEDAETVEDLVEEVEGDGVRRSLPAV